MRFKLPLPAWTIIAPLLGVIVLIIPAGLGSITWTVVLALILVTGVLSAVHHAEVVAHKLGEPYGTLLLAVAVTVIEVALIISLMLAAGDGATMLARDTVFAAIMIILTGIIGLCLLAGGMRYREQIIGRYGVSAALVTLTAISVLTLILPNYTTSVSGPVYNNSQLIFVALVSLVLYLTFTMVQTVTHRDYFLPAETEAEKLAHAAPPPKSVAWMSFSLLLVALGVVILLAKKLAPVIEDGVESVGAPKSLVGIIVAGVILVPEGLAAFRAARRNRLQTSLNLALGSALASIGLTIPAVSLVALIQGYTITLGIDMKSTLLLILSLFTIMLSFGTGRTTILQGVVLLVIFAVYLFTTVVP